MSDAFAENQQFTRGDGTLYNGSVAEEDAAPQSPVDLERAGILRQARQLITESTNHYETSYYSQWLRSQANFNSKHPPGSKYHTNLYKTRSRAFRPKTRGTVRKNEAAAAIAYFSSTDPLVVNAANPDDVEQEVAAAIWGSILKHRLEKKMPWFQTAIGGYQDTQVMGLCIFNPYWKYEQNGDGDVIADDLAVDLVPPENFRFHPKSDWRNPVEDSPFLIHVFPMVVDEVQLKMESGEWHMAPESTIVAAVRDWNSVDAQRDQKTAHKQQGNDQGIKAFDTVWICKMIQRHRGVDYCYFVLGEHHLLTDPEPLDELTPGGVRNYVVGVSNIEAHKVIPAGMVEVYQDVQALTNDIANQRIDNVKLSMNGRYLARRQGKIDLGALTRSVPGGVVFTDDPEGDIKRLEIPDVTGSSYQEQDRINMDFDELAGHFSQSSVNTNRKLGETVGGMELLTGDSNMMMEYQLRIFNETGVKPLLRMLLKFEQAYETDINLKALAANENLEMLKRYGVNEITDELLDQELECDVSVGIDATNPDRRMQKLMVGVQTAGELGVPLDGEEISKEVFGILGFGSGKRFISTEEQPPSPEQVQAEADSKKAQADMQMKQVDAQVKSEVAQLTLQREQLALQREQLQSQDAQAQSQMKQQEMMQRLDEAERKYQVELQKMGADMQKLQAQIQSNEAIAVLNDDTERLKIGVQAQQQDAERAERRDIEGAKLGEQARQADASRDEQAREFDKNIESQEKQKDADRAAAKSQAKSGDSDG